jgi:simple sugar transport system permease protein
MLRRLRRREAPATSLITNAAIAGLAILAAMALTSLLFATYDASPMRAYYELFREPFATLRGFGYTLVRTAPLILIGLGTIVSWRSGFAYLGFEGCFVLGAAAASWFALSTESGSLIGPLPAAVFFPGVILISFLAGSGWAGIVGIIRARFGGNEVLISLMSNYVAILIVQYLVSGPMRAPGGLPETNRFPHATWLPFILPGTRAHAGILLAIAAAVLVWVILQWLPIGYELVVIGFNPAAARYAGIQVGNRIVFAAAAAGGLGALAGMVEVLGAQHRLIDGVSGGVGFVGVIVALLAQLSPLAVLLTALLYGGMSVGADAMQRHANIPASITFILQSLIVLLVLASGLLRNYTISFDSLDTTGEPLE